MLRRYWIMYRVTRFVLFKCPRKPRQWPSLHETGVLKVAHISAVQSLIMSLITPVIFLLWHVAHTHVCSSKVWHTEQESLVVSDWCSCHCHAQRLRSASSKYTSANLCAQSGLKMRCGEAHYWCIAILKQEKAIGPLTNKNLVESQWHSIPPAI